MKIASAANVGMSEACRLMNVRTRRSEGALLGAVARDAGHAATFSALGSGRTVRRSAVPPVTVRAMRVDARRLDEHDDDHDDGEEDRGSAADGTPRNRIVELRVWMMRTPTTVPAMLNLPPMSEVPPRTTARIA